MPPEILNQRGSMESDIDRSEENPLVRQIIELGKKEEEKDREIADLRARVAALEVDVAQMMEHLERTGQYHPSTEDERAQQAEEWKVQEKNKNQE